jgi:hypothetical protein
MNASSPPGWAFAGLVVMGLLASSMAPASAIFGLSKCEKVKKQILQEEKINISIGKYREKARLEFIKKIAPTYPELAEYYYQIILSTKSDLAVYALMVKNPGCYDTKINAAVRRYKGEASLSLKGYKGKFVEISGKYLYDPVPGMYSKWMSSTGKAGFVSVYDKNFLKFMNQ